jgi:intergrase/recombinase
MLEAIKLGNSKNDGPGGIRTLDLRRVSERLDLLELYKEHRSAFIDYLIKIRAIDLKLAKDYVSAIDRLLPEGITNPKELERALIEIKSKDKLVKGLRNFLNYLEHELEVYDLNGYSLDAWRKRLKIPKVNVREVYITDEELKEAYEYVKDKLELELCFKLLVFSGLRLKHLWLALKDFDSSRIIIKGNIARYPVSHVSKATKKAYWIYMPAELVEELKPFSFNYWYYQKGIKHGRVDANSIRKWHLNKLIELGVPESIADFIQGRASLTVGSTHYLNKTKQADEFYSRIVDSLKVIA